MPRPRRVTPVGYCYHVLNRGNARQRVFHKEADYAAFLRLFDEAQERCPMRLLAYCLMPNHFHLVLWPHRDGDVSRRMATDSNMLPKPRQLFANSSHHKQRLAVARLGYKLRRPGRIDFGETNHELIAL